MAIPRELIALYQGLSKKEIFYLHARWLISPIEAVEHAIPARGKLYDIGCGVGLLSNTAALRSPARNIVGVDISAEKIGIARKSVGERKNIAFLNSDALKIPLEDPDVVMLCDTLHHIPAQSQERLLRHIHQSLDCGGILLVQDIDKRPLHKYLFARWVDLLMNMMEPVYYRDSGEWIRLLESIGFEVESKKLNRGYPIAAVLFKCVKI